MTTLLRAVGTAVHGPTAASKSTAAIAVARLDERIFETIPRQFAVRSSAVADEWTVAKRKLGLEIKKSSALCNDVLQRFAMYDQ